MSKSDLQITVLLIDDVSKCWIQVYFSQRYQSRFGYLQIRQAMLVAIHRHKPLVEGFAPNPLLNTELHSVAARYSNALRGYAPLPELMDRKKRDIMERKGDKEDENKRQKQQKESSAAAL